MSSSVSQFGYSRAEWYRRYYIEQIAKVRMQTALIGLAAHVAQLIGAFRRQYLAQKRQISILEDQQARRRMFWALELRMLNDYGLDGNPQDDPPTADEYGKIYSGRLWAPVALKYEEQLKNLKCNAGKYTTSYNRQAVSKLMMARAVDYSNTRLYGRWLGQMEWYAKDDLYWQRKFDTIALGTGVLSTASNAAAMATNGFAQLANGYAAQAWADAQEFRAATYSTPAGMGGYEFHTSLENMLDVRNESASYTMEMDGNPLSNPRASGSEVQDIANKTATGSHDNLNQLSTTADPVATGSFGRDWMGTSPPMVGSTSMWQDRARTAKVTWRYPVTVIDTYTGGGMGWVDVNLSPFDLRYVDDQEVSVSESGRPV